MPRSRCCVLLTAVTLTALSLVQSTDAHEGEAAANICSGESPFGRISCCLTEVDVRERGECLERRVEEEFGAQEIHVILAAFDDARRANMALESQCHPIAHAIGRIAYRRTGDIGQAFQACTDSCWFGCYHGVMERMLAPEGAEEHVTVEQFPALLPGLCNPEELGSDGNRLAFQCFHGLGHAILFTLDYALLDTLALCDLLEREEQREWCYSGVFMENVVASQREKRNLKAHDPLYPCNAVPEHTKSRCMLDQTRVFYHLGWTDQQVATACHAASPFEGECFESMGRDISMAFREGDAPRVVRACEGLAMGHADACVRGVIHGLTYTTQDGRAAFSFCQWLHEENLQDTCFRAAGNTLRRYYERSDEGIAADCEAAGPLTERCRELAERPRDPVGAAAWQVIAGIGAFFASLFGSTLAAS